MDRIHIYAVRLTAECIFCFKTLGEFESQYEIGAHGMSRITPERCQCDESRAHLLTSNIRFSVDTQLIMVGPK